MLNVSTLDNGWTDSRYLSDLTHLPTLTDMTARWGSANGQGPSKGRLRAAREREILVGRGALRRSRGKILR